MLGRQSLTHNVQTGVPLLSVQCSSGNFSIPRGDGGKPENIQSIAEVYVQNTCIKRNPLFAVFLVE